MWCMSHSKRIQRPLSGDEVQVWWPLFQVGSVRSADGVRTCLVGPLPVGAAPARHAYATDDVDSTELDEPSGSCTLLYLQCYCSLIVKSFFFFFVVTQHQTRTEKRRTTKKNEQTSAAPATATGAY